MRLPDSQGVKMSVQKLKRLVADQAVQPEAR
jgi:hypothetical protein